MIYQNLLGQHISVQKKVDICKENKTDIIIKCSNWNKLKSHLV